MKKRYLQKVSIKKKEKKKKNSVWWEWLVSQWFDRFTCLSQEKSQSIHGDRLGVSFIEKFVLNSNET